MIQLQQVSLQIGRQFLLQSASLSIFPGQKVGLIGANGSGKSTLFRMLLGELACDAGHWDLPSGWRIAHMAQEVEALERRALDYVLDGDRELRKVEDELEPAQGETMAREYAEMEPTDGYSAPATD